MGLKGRRVFGNCWWWEIFLGIGSGSGGWLDERRRMQFSLSSSENRITCCAATATAIDGGRGSSTTKLVSGRDEDKHFLKKYF